MTPLALLPLTIPLAPSVLPPTLPLQAGLFSAAELALVSVDFLSAVVSVVISYIAYRGYRRSGNRAMAFVAAGFVLIMVVPWVAFVAGLVAGGSRGAELAIGAVSEVSQLLGMLAILYAIRLETKR